MNVANSALHDIPFRSPCGYIACQITTPAPGVNPPGPTAYNESRPKVVAQTPNTLETMGSISNYVKEICSVSDRRAGHRPDQGIAFNAAREHHILSAGTWLLLLPRGVQQSTCPLLGSLSGPRRSYPMGPGTQNTARGSRSNTTTAETRSLQRRCSLLGLVQPRSAHPGEHLSVARRRLRGPPEVPSAVGNGSTHTPVLHIHPLESMHAFPGPGP